MPGCRARSPGGAASCCSLPACRAVPAEASSIAAGLAGMPPLSALLVSAAANLGISAVYAWMGASLAETASLAAAFAALALSGLSLGLAATLRGPAAKRVPQPSTRTKPRTTRLVCHEDRPAELRGRGGDHYHRRKQPSLPPAREVEGGRAGA